MDATDMSDGISPLAGRIFTKQLFGAKPIIGGTVRPASLFPKRVCKALNKRGIGNSVLTRMSAGALEVERFAAPIMS